jgi:hypothetical protein
VPRSATTPARRRVRRDGCGRHRSPRRRAPARCRRRPGPARRRRPHDHKTRYGAVEYADCGSGQPVQVSDPDSPVMCSANYRSARPTPSICTTTPRCRNRTDESGTRHLSGYLSGTDAPRSWGTGTSRAGAWSSSVRVVAARLVVFTYEAELVRLGSRLSNQPSRLFPTSVHNDATPRRIACRARRPGRGRRSRGAAKLGQVGPRSGRCRETAASRSSGPSTAGRVPTPFAAARPYLFGWPVDRIRGL